MRPIKLKMSAFGPYRFVELDFEKNLGDNNFFLIHGATGSGKTTILDAICYALYGESSGGGRKSSMMRSEAAAPTDKTEIEFTFSLRGKTYKIIRNPAYSRPKLRGDGLTEEKASAEIFEDDKPLEAKEVSEYVENLLGLGKEQFRQVVILPQGEFKKFLLAKSNEKQEVLNTLFNADFFKRVEDELKIKATNAKRIFETLSHDLKKLLDDAGVLEERELPTLIKKLEDEFKAAQAQLKTLEVQSLDAQKKFSDGENLSRLFKDLETKSQALVDTQNLLEKISSELSVAQIEFDKRQAEEPLRENLKLRAADLAKKKIALQNLQTKEKELAAAMTTAEKSAAEVERLQKLKKSCDDTMAKLTAEEESLRDVPAKKISAKKVLDDAKSREELIQAIEELRKKTLAAEKILSAATINLNTAEQRLSELRQAQADGSAYRLALTLEEGKPCPVCGAIHHPTPATSDSAIPTDAQIKAAENKLKTLSNEKNNAAENLARLKGELVTKEKNLSESAQVVTVAEAQAAFDKILADEKELNRCRTRIIDGREKTPKVVAKLEAAQAADKKFAGTLENLRGAVDNMRRELDEKLLGEEISSVNRQLEKLNTEFQRSQDNFNRLNRLVAAQKSTVEAAEKNKAEVAAQVEGNTPPDMPALKKIRDETRTAERAAVETKTKLSERLERLKFVTRKIFALTDELKAADKNFLMWTTLSEAASGKISKISFQRYYLSTMFKEVILEANNRLEKMSGGRYRFQNKEGVTDGRIRSAGLDLEIVDEYTGTARPVETLSGGESFLASLSLALGLAAVVQNNSGGIKLDTIFIDEGFGTLDSETLDFAMKTLIELQSGGRLVGIISHVEELRNQMPIRLEVTKTKTGSIAKFVGTC